MAAQCLPYIILMYEILATYTALGHREIITDLIEFHLNGYIFNPFQSGGVRLLEGG